MTNVAEITGRATSAFSLTKLRTLLTRLWPSVLIYSGVLIAAIAAMKLPTATDYVGPDNDDGMRLVEVRDLLAGQGWFDLMQYRLGVGGTLMHWSRLVDLPLASLIRFFGLFLSTEKAETVALAVWPLSLIIPLMLAMAIAARRIGGIAAMHISLGLTALMVMTSGRFLPGAIDHHNVQLCLVAMMIAMLLDEKYRAWSYTIAGFCAALAIAIGVETTPVVAAVCITVAISWAWHGETYAAAAKAFGLSMALFISIFFFGTIPQRLYSTVTCDSLSLGFYSLSATGGGLLLAVAVCASHLSRSLRFVALAGIGAIVAVSALVIAPQCLHNPMNDLDPMLIELWLNGISEARSIIAMGRTEPYSLGAFYAVGLLGVGTCVFRIFHRDRVEVHLILLVLLGVSWAIALVQVRGAAFSNMISILPLALLIIDMRRFSNGERENIAAALCYIMVVLASVPAAWAVAGGFAEMQRETPEEKENAAKEDDETNSCKSRDAVAPLNTIPVGMIAASSEMGVPILRFTGQHVLTAPYHRNPQGMLTELHIGLSDPKEAQAFLRGAGVTMLAFCKDDPSTAALRKLKSEGLYAQLAKGNIPSYLRPFAKAKSVEYYLFKPVD
ncbi:hypothetical protein [Rhizobium sullae]|uniref:Oligosaccharyl transferase-like protein n=1 Tax=Rhizobium sullae TaxID=50338 RepID=A0A4R3QF58_RHISU|nr:hypothetical protein [Rhizobium sullae]TCU18282.1 hypothetical protein EV132_103402 [Rhizobium sullae]